ncbi:MAG: hypothetical protein KF799_03905 [Bdellovibrionales bacterium]|nr:hypothetical protein [Bdellovibrionales bacterium]
MDVNPAVFQHMDKLPAHEGLCAEILLHFRQQPGIIGAFVSGSGAAGKMDRHSDLDLGFICENREMREKIWRQRFHWRLPNWFHRMDADHIKPYFVIYLFEPDIHVDLCFYTREDLPSQAGGPFVLAWDQKALLRGWIRHVNEPYRTPPEWSAVVHEDERFWTWMHYQWSHTNRGEYYDSAMFMSDLRAIIEKWHARLNGSEIFRSRRIEERGDTSFIESMKATFPLPDCESLKNSYLAMIEIHNRQRAEIDKMVKPEWKTSTLAREKITRLVQEL